MKKLIFTALVLCGTFGTLELSTRPAYAIDCSLVRCMACPAGYVFAPLPNDCCRCIKKNA